MFEGLADWLMKISWPVVSRVLAALGVGTVTYTGASEAAGSAVAAAKSAFTGLAGDVVQIIAMTGFFDAMAIAAGSLFASLAWMVLKRFALQVGTASGS